MRRYICFQDAELVEPMFSPRFNQAYNCSFDYILLRSTAACAVFNSACTFTGSDSMLTDSSVASGAGAGGIVAWALSATRTHLCLGGTSAFWGSVVGVFGPGPHFPRVEGPLVPRMWKMHVSSSYYSSSGHWMGPERGELVEPRTGSTTAGGVQGGRSSGLGPGHTLDIR